MGGLAAPPNLPGRGRGGRGAGNQEALRGCPLTSVPAPRPLRSHVLPSDQSAPVCQQLLPDPAQ